MAASILLVEQGQIAPPERVVAGAVADRAEPGHLRLDCGHAFPDGAAFRRPIVQRHHGSDAREAFDLLRLFGQRLCDGCLAPGAEVGPQAESAESRKRQGDDHRRRHQTRVFADSLVELVNDAGSSRRDGLAVEETAKVLRHLPRGRIAPFLLLLQTLEDDRFEIDWNRRLDTVGRYGVTFGDARHHFRVGACVGRLAGEKPVKRGADPINVCPPVELGGFPAHLLRRAEGGGSEDHP